MHRSIMLEPFVTFPEGSAAILKDTTVNRERSVEWGSVSAGSLLSN